MTPFYCSSQLFRWFENRNGPLRNPNNIARFGVSSCSTRPFDNLEGSEPAYFDMIALFEGRNDRSQEPFEHCRCIRLRQPRRIGYLINDVGLGHNPSLYPRRRNRPVRVTRTSDVNYNNPKMLSIP